MKHVCLIVIILLAGFSFSYGVPNKKFIEKATEEVWSTQIDTFDPNVDIDPEFSSGHSAVIIGAYYGVNGKLSQSSSVTRGDMTKTSCTTVNRFMVKLFDQSAVDYYSDFSYGGQSQSKLARGYLKRKLDNAFGARIHKADGTLRNVDLSDALEETSGKGGKEIDGYKIVIPGLEVGDVLEYFYYTKEEVDELSPRRTIIPFCKRYPVLNFEIHGEFDPRLTVECRSVNGAHDLSTSPSDGKNPNVVSLKVSGISAMPDEEWSFPYRQMPFVEMQVLNNESAYGISSIKRREGVFSLPAGMYFADIRSVIKMISTDGSKAKRKAENIVKAFKKDNPNALRKELADVTWLALTHSMVTEKESLNDLALALCMQDILQSQGVEPDSLGIGFTCSRNDFSINDILSWEEPDYVAIVGDDIYYLDNSGVYIPGEFPAVYHGEEVAAFMGKRENLSKSTMLRSMRIPQSRTSQNVLVQELTLSVNLQDGMTRLSRKSQAAGHAKSVLHFPQEMNEYLTSIEDFMGLPEKNRHKKITFDELEHSKNSKEAMLDEAENRLGVRPAEIHSFSVNSWGNIPDNPLVEWEMECDMPDLTEDLGDDLELKVGKLLGYQEKLTDSQKDRMLDVMIPAPMRMLTTINIEIPDGYKVDETSLQAIFQNTNTSSGQVLLMPELLEDGNVRMQCMYKFNKSHVPVEEWPNFAVLIDAAADVAASSIILVKQ